MALQKVLGQLQLEAATDCVVQYFIPLQVESDQLQLWLLFNILSVFSITSTAQMSWNGKLRYPPPQPPSMIYGKEAKTIIAFLLLLFFQG